jgi:very-short-patch-repair endonuclease
LIPGMSRRYRPDFRSERHRLIVEFDGDEHYRSAKKILRDEERDRALACRAIVLFASLTLSSSRTW